MEEIIKILEEHNIKCVYNDNDLVLSHKNFYIHIENITSCFLVNKLDMVEIKNGKNSS